jgi:uncharacterized protein (TIGR02186 family)
MPMKIRVLICGFLMLWLALPVEAKPLVADLDNYRISIDSDFVGDDLLLFGARNDPGDILIVVRGPERDITIRKKERKFGLWMNAEEMVFQNVPYYYAVTGTRPLAELTNSRLYDLLNLGLENIDLTPPRPATPALQQEFAQAFINAQIQQGLYQDYKETPTFMGATLFKTLINFPDTLPRGDYSAEIYLIENGMLRAVQTLPIEVTKVGFDAFVYDVAQRMPLLYGLIAVLVAILAGLAVSNVFGRLVP